MTSHWKAAAAKSVIATAESAVSAADAWPMGALVRMSASLALLWTAGCVVPVASQDGPVDASTTPLPDGAMPPSDGGGPASDGPVSEADIVAVDAVPPAGTWTNVTGNLVGLSSTCASLAGMSAKPDEDLLVASVSGNGLWAMRAGSNTWAPMPSPDAGSIVNRMTTIVYDPASSGTFWESGIYGASPFLTTDDGTTFLGLGVSYNDLISVDLTDPNRNTILVGGHEASQADALFRSSDKGMTWESIGAQLPPNTNCTLPVVLDAGTYLVGCGGYGGGVSGIYRTVDSAATWQQATLSGGGVPPLRASDGSIYWLGSNGGLTKSTDDGQTWTDLAPGGSFPGPQGGLTNYDIMELPGGSLALMGSQYIMVSSDKGVTWSPATTALPITANEDLHGAVYSTQRKAFYIWHNTCGASNSVVADAIMRYDYP
jgi:hypothetical protein